MAVEAKTAEVDGKEIPNARELTGLPSDKKERQSVLQSIGAAAKRESTILIRRGDRAFIAKDKKAADAVRSAFPVARESKYKELVSF